MHAVNKVSACSSAEELWQILYLVSFTTEEWQIQKVYKFSIFILYTFTKDIDISYNLIHSLLHTINNLQLIFHIPYPLSAETNINIFLLPF